MSSVNEEIIEGIMFWGKRNGVTINKKALMEHMKYDKERRTIMVLPMDMLLSICSHMNIYDMFSILLTCKEFSAFTKYIWRFCESLYFEGSTMSSSGATMIAVKESIAVDWFSAELHDLHIFFIIEPLMEKEMYLKRLEEKGKAGEGRLEHQTNTREMKCYIDEIEDFWEHDAPYLLVELVQKFALLFKTPKNLSSKPSIDPRLLTGRRARAEEEERRRLEELTSTTGQNRGYDYDSD
jgi:hypothetical protein